MANTDYNGDIATELGQEYGSIQKLIAPGLIQEHMRSIEDINEKDLDREFEEMMATEDGVMSGMLNVITALAVMHVQGYSRKQIVSRFPILTLKRLDSITTTDAYKEVVLALTNETIEKAKTFMQSSSLQATKTLVELLQSQNEKIRLDAAKTILDRTGLKSAEVHVIEDKRNYIPKDITKSLKELDYGMEEIRKSLQITAESNNKEAIIDVSVQGDAEARPDKGEQG
jgi:hypothetical protein